MHRRSTSSCHHTAQDRPCVTYFIRISTFNLHSKPRGKQCCPILQRRHLGPEGPSNLPKDTQLIQRQKWIQTPACCLPTLSQPGLLPQQTPSGLLHVGIFTSVSTGYRTAPKESVLGFHHREPEGATTSHSNLASQGPRPGFTTKGP